MSKRSKMRQRQRVVTQAAPSHDEEEIDIVEEELPGEETDTEVEIVEGEEGEDTSESDGEDPYEVLQRNYEAALQAKDDAERRWQETESRRQELDRRRAELESHAERQAVSEYANHRALIEHALMAADGEATNAEVMYANALAEGDYASAARAQRAMASAEIKRARLQEGKDALETQSPAPIPRTERQATVDPYDPIEQQISGFTPKSQMWLRAHKGDIFGSDDRREDAVYFDSKARRMGLAADSDEYFAFLDKSMGYGAQDAGGTTPTAQAPAKPRAAIRPSAPVSRNASGSARTPVHLTADEKDAALRMGMTPVRYAEMKAKIARGETNVRFTEEGGRR